MRTLLAFGVLAAAMSLTSRDAQAARWCVYYDAYTYTCGFTSFQQCQATAFGAGGFCRRDPYAAPNEGQNYPVQRGRRSRDRDAR